MKRYRTMPIEGLDTLVKEADQFFITKQYLSALPLYRQAVELRSADPDLRSNLATVLMQLGQFEEASVQFAQALAFNANNTAALNNYAALLGRLGKHNDALARLKQLAKLLPEDAEILSNVGVALNRLERHAEALQWFDRAIDLEPNLSDAHYSKAIALADLGKTEEASKHCRFAIKSNPDGVPARLLLAMVTLPSIPSTAEESRLAPAKFFQAISEIADWTKDNPRRLEVLGDITGNHQPFNLAYRPGNHRAALLYYGDLMARAAQAYWHRRGMIPFQSPPAKRNRIRLAILSKHISRHSVWDIILKGIIKHIDRRCFELVIYHSGSTIDEQSRWAQKKVDRFEQGPKGNTDWMKIIQKDLPDIIFFPEIGMDPLTCKLAALRLAPLQVASWGHPVTTGLPEIDLYFSGNLIEGAAAQAHYRERLILLPGCGACTDPILMEAAPLTAVQIDLPADRTVVRFIICQRPFKLEPSDDILIARLIRQASPSKVYLMCDQQYPWASEAIKNRLSAALSLEGIDPESCLVEVPWLKRETFLGLLDEMDVYLDMPAFSGYTTAWQALHRGIPIVTLEGEFMRQRLAAGLLRKIEQIETIAQTKEEYIEIAVRLAQECRNPELRTKRRAAIKAAAPKADHDVSVVRAFEETLINELAARGHAFDFAEHSSAMTSRMADSATNLPESTIMNTENNPTVYPWQMLNADLHLHTLTPNYAPTGLLAMMPEYRDENRKLKVLDVGCFCGGSGRWIKQKFPGAELIGIEMLPKAAEVAAEDYDKVIVSTFEDVDFEAEGLARGSVDAIIAADVLEHLYNPWQALQRLKLLLAPGGAIYISLPNIRNLNILNALAKGEWEYAGAGILDITHIRFFTKKQALEMLAQTGWQATEIRINPDPRLMPAFEGKDLSQIQNIELDNFKLTGLSQEDVLELLALQLFIRAEPL